MNDRIIARVKSNDPSWLVMIIAIDKDGWEALCVDRDGKFLVVPLDSLVCEDYEIREYLRRWDGS